MQQRSLRRHRLLTTFDESNLPLHSRRQKRKVTIPRSDAVWVPSIAGASQDLPSFGDKGTTSQGILDTSCDAFFMGKLFLMWRPYREDFVYSIPPPLSLTIAPSEYSFAVRPTTPLVKSSNALFQSMLSEIKIPPGERWSQAIRYSKAMFS